MNLEKRIIKLEEKASRTHIDPSLVDELTEWFKSHPRYFVFAQPEYNNGVVMPEHLSQAFGRILNKTLAERNLKPSCSSLLQILDPLSEIFKGYAKLK